MRRAWLRFHEVGDSEERDPLPIHVELAPSRNTMEVAAILELRQREELLPIQGDGILNLAVNLKFPFVQRDLWPDSEIEDGKIVNLMLTWRQPVGRPHCGSLGPCHLSRPTFFCCDVRVLHPGEGYRNRTESASNRA